MMLFLKIAGILAFLCLAGFLVIHRFRSRRRLGRSLDMVFLRISIPIKDSREDREKEGEKSFADLIDGMRHFFESLHAIYSDDFSSKLGGQDHVSFEYVVLGGLLQFYVVVPSHLVGLIDKQLTASFSDLFIEPVPDYNIFREGQRVAALSVGFSKDSLYPIRTYHFLGSDPLNNIANAFSRVSSDEGVSVQIMVRPIPDDWQEKGREAVADVMKGKKKKSLLQRFNILSGLGTLLRLIVSGADDHSLSDKDPEAPAPTTPSTEEQVKLMEAKNSRVGFETVIRVVASAKGLTRAKQITKDVMDSFVQFHAPRNNSFTTLRVFSLPGVIRRFVLRDFSDGFLPDLFRKPMVLSSEELASVFHLPNIRFNQSPIIKWQEFKIAPAPSNLPSHGLFLGNNIFRGEKRPVYVKRDDRRRHFYIIGKSGTGKSTILKTMLKQDVSSGEGICLIDPHGDLVEGILPHIPRKLADNIILFDPGDLDRPMGLNILEAYTREQKEFMSQEALAIFIKMFGEEIMGPRLQHYFRNGCLTLMDDDDEGATIIDVPRLFTDDSWQRYKISKVKNPVVRGFWEKEMASTGAREKQEMIPYFSAKFGAFITNAQIRNIIGQPRSGFDFRKVMDEGKILLCNLSKGKLGDLNSNLLGMVMVSKLQMAAMSRVDTPEEERKDFYLYVDEFQNFVTDSFASILSEARKYRLNLIIAHQYISQITKMSGGGKGTHEDTAIRDAVFGNVGSMLSFKIGAQDAEYMAKEFSPVFTEQDLINISNFQAYLKLNIDNATSRGFSMATVYDPSKGDREAAEAYRQLSRLKFARERDFVEREIFRRVGTKFLQESA